MSFRFQEMLLEGMLEHGIYLHSDLPDDCNGLTIEEIMESYGIYSKVKQCPQGRSAGYSPEDTVDPIEYGNDLEAPQEEEACIQKNGRMKSIHHITLSGVVQKVARNKRLNYLI